MQAVCKSNKRLQTPEKEVLLEGRENVVGGPENLTGEFGIDFSTRRVIIIIERWEKKMTSPPGRSACVSGSNAQGHPLLPKYF
jgi:hypothetical protein